jgi:aryl sulfotransferase
VRTYRTERSERWAGFEHRPGDIVISTRSKCGTTWVQMVCLSLVHGTPLPAPLALLSPWIDWDVEPTEAVHRRLAEQPHRRVIKTHTPLDGIPLADDVRYLVVGRHPLGVAVSLFHHVANIDQVRSAQLRHRPPAEVEPTTLDAWVDDWIADDRPPEDELDTLAGNVHHLTDARRRVADGNVLLVHFGDLVDDRAATMRAIAVWLDIEVPDDRWPDLVAATSFDSMRADPVATVPDRLGVLRDPAAFFRSGAVGDGHRLCSPATVQRYERRIGELADPDLIAWLHRS